MKENSLLVIIAAAGSGERFGGDIPKQYMQLNGKSVIENSVYPFLVSKYVKKVIIAISKNDEFIEKQDFYNSKKVEFVHGGDSRQHSIKNALDLDNKEFEFVITHDAARPNVSEADITNLYKDILNTNVSCSFLYTPVYDSIKLIDENDITKDKDKFFLVQTPQISKQKDLRNALNKCIEDEG
jgi:4-diphosphocytidyl-2-methyl-D-erithritol synthase